MRRRGRALLGTFNAFPVRKTIGIPMQEAQFAVRESPAPHGINVERAPMVMLGN